MPQAIIFTTKEEDDKIKEYSMKWKTGKKKLSKQETIKKMIRDFK